MAEIVVFTPWFQYEGKSWNKHLNQSDVFYRKKDNNVNQEVSENAWNPVRVSVTNVKMILKYNTLLYIFKNCMIFYTYLRIQIQKDQKVDICL